MYVPWGLRILQAPKGHGAHHFQNATFWSRGPTGDLTKKYIDAGFINFLYSYFKAFSCRFQVTWIQRR
jgi:hypothetical protein